MGQEEVHGGGAGGEDPGNYWTGQDRPRGGPQNAIIWSQGLPTSVHTYTHTPAVVALSD